MSRLVGPYRMLKTIGKRSVTAIIVAAAVSLAACGGSASKTSAAVPKDGSGSPAVTTANVVAVVRAATQAAMQAHGVFAFAGVQGDGLLSPATVVSGASNNIAGFAWAQWRQLSDRSDVHAAVQAAADRALVNVPMRSCAGGGTVAISLNDVDNNGVTSNGDSATFLFENCTDNRITANGAMTMSGVSITGTPAAPPAAVWSFRTQLLFAALSLVDEMGAIAVDGTAAIDWQRSSVSSTSGAIDLTGLTIQEQGVATTFSSATLNTVDNDLASTSSLSLTGALNVAGVGSMNVATAKPMLMIKDSGHPASGEVTIQMARSIVSVFTRENVAVDIDLDSDGDGVRDSTQRTTWQQIHNVEPDIRI